MKKRIFCLFLIVAFVMMPALQIFATESESVSTELISLAKEADNFYRLLRYEFSAVAMLNPDSYLSQFALSKGYVDPAVSSDDRIDLDFSKEMGYDFDFTNPYYPCSPEMNTLEKWKVEVEEYFTWDMYGLVTPPEGTFNYRIIEHNDRVYVYGMSESYFTPHWDTAELVSVNEKTATISVVSSDGSLDDLQKGTYTIEFENTENGWRVSGGSYFGLEYGSGTTVQPPAQETGDHAVHALCLSCAALVCLGFLVFRKKRI